MKPSLDGIRLKRDRAWRQLHVLKPEIIDFIESDPYVPRVEFHGQSEQLILRVDVKRGIDPMWSVRIGEIIHNLRCCFDYLAHELYVWKNRKFPESRIQFPIFMDESNFVSHGIKRFLPGIDGTHVDMIRSEQPFSTADGGTGEGRNSPLWHLYELSNADKHRTLQLTGTTIENFEFTFPRVTQKIQYRLIEVKEPGPVEKDTILWRGHMIGVTEWPFSKKEFHSTLLIDVAFDQRVTAVGGLPVHSILNNIANRTDRILRRFFNDVWGTQL